MQHRGLEAAEAEIPCPGNPGARQRVGRPAILRNFLDNGPTRIAETHQPRRLVKSLTRGIVPGPADSPELSMALEQGEVRMPAGYDEAQQRESG